MQLDCLELKVVAISYRFLIACNIHRLKCKIQADKAKYIWNNSENEKTSYIT